ncbi:hypothetical protein D3C85_1411940 [compost metagenome]
MRSLTNLISKPLPDPRMSRCCLNVVVEVEIGFGRTNDRIEITRTHLIDEIGEVISVSSVGGYPISISFALILGLFDLPVRYRRFCEFVDPLK